MPQTSKGIEERVALVTGAGRGVGKGIALELARAGCRTAVNYHRSAESAQETVAEVEAMGGAAIAVQADVASAADVSEMVAKVI
jgi:3-oxoacyl-[acyl-carrier protein] reductase